MDRKAKGNGHESQYSSPYATRLQRKPAQPASTHAHSGVVGRKVGGKDATKTLYNSDQHARQAAPPRKPRPLLKRHSRSNLPTGHSSPRSNRTSPLSIKGSYTSSPRSTVSQRSGKPPLRRNASVSSIQIKPTRSARRSSLGKTSSLDDEHPVVKSETPTELDTTARSSPDIPVKETRKESDPGEPETEPSEEEGAAITETKSAPTEQTTSRKQSVIPTSSNTSSTTSSNQTSNREQSGISSSSTTSSDDKVSVSSGSTCVIRKHSDTESIRKGYQTVFSIRIPNREPVPISRILQSLHSTDEDNIETELSESDAEASEDIDSSEEEEEEGVRRTSGMFKREKKKRGASTVSRSSSKGSVSSSKGSVSSSKGSVSSNKGSVSSTKGSVSGSKASISSKSSLTEDKIKDIERAFAIFDKNSDGSITRQELAEVLLDADVTFTDQELDMFMAKLDKDGNGQVDYKEFCHMMSDVVSAALELDSRMRTAFSEIDQNGDGQISPAELRDAMTQLGEKVSEKEAADLISSIDKNGDKHIDYEEFVTMMYTLNIK